MRTQLFSLPFTLAASVACLVAGATSLNAQELPPEYLDRFQAPFQHQNNHATYRFPDVDWLRDFDTLGGELEETFNALHLCLIPVGEHRGKVLGWNYAPNRDENAPPQQPLGAHFWSIIDPEVAPAPGGFMNFRYDVPDTDGEKNDLACAGHTWLPNGRLLVAGGTTKYSATGHPTVSGARLLYLFDPMASPPTWDPVPGPSLLVKKLVVHASAQLCKAISNDTTRGFCGVPQQGNQWTSLAPCAVPDMHFPRVYLNTVLLPDASILAVGGSQTFGGVGVTQVELLRGGGWELGASMTANRVYHSTAVLLPSGKVLLAAGEGRIWDYQVYEPRYLNWGKPKPQWSVQGPPWQENVTYNDEVFADFTLTGTGGVLSKVVLMRPGSVTHHFDQDQRYVQLPTAVFGNSVSFLMPADSNAAPRGFYMVFLVTSDGTPSVARWINLQ